LPVDNWLKIAFIVLSPSMLVSSGSVAPPTSWRTFGKGGADGSGLEIFHRVKVLRRLALHFAADPLVRPLAI
jgi:hypothetical protein